MDTISVTSRVWLKQKVEDEHTDGKTERNKRKWKSNLINFAFYINPINYLLFVILYAAYYFIGAPDANGTYFFWHQPESD